MKRAMLAAIVVVLYALHQDFWFWRTARPLVFGFIPVGLAYHACYTLATALVMWILVKYTWPSHLEQGSAGFSLQESENEKSGEGGNLQTDAD
jgi:hypothetical protein